MSTTIIVPTYNEAENIAELVRRLPKDVSVLVVDDSPNDETAKAARGTGAEVLHRTNGRGLSSAVIDGLRICYSEKIIVMDADLQHPPELVPELIKQLDTHDLVVASRTSSPGLGVLRRLVSLTANLLALPLCPKIKDRMSGFFGFRRIVVDPASLGTRGYKVMLEVAARGGYESVTEVPYTFGARERGTSKLTKKVIYGYILQLASLYLHKFAWIKFGIVGGIGTLIHLAVLYLLTDIAGIWYLVSAIMSIVVASTSNYFLNHLWTFRDRREYIRNHFLGWLKYQGMSGITDAMYIGLLVLFVEVAKVWYMMGAVLAILIVFVIKFKVAKHWIWRKGGLVHG